MVLVVESVAGEIVRKARDGEMGVDEKRRKGSVADGVQAFHRFHVVQLDLGGNMVVRNDAVVIVEFDVRLGVSDGTGLRV